MRRNDIVLVGKPDLYNFYGRINRVLGDGNYEVVDCGAHMKVRHESELRLANDYKGKFEWGKGENARFLRMPTLRKLKQYAREYAPYVWVKNRKKHQKRLTSDDIFNEMFPE